jgi:5'-deoxynucleotidase YfbR-like HD superfamily hydrolase
VARKVVWGADDSHPHGWADLHRNHVFGDLLAQAHARVEALGHDIGEAIVDDDLDVKIRIGRQQLREHRLQHRD